MLAQELAVEQNLLQVARRPMHGLTSEVIYLGGGGPQSGGEDVGRTAGDVVRSIGRGKTIDQFLQQSMQFNLEFHRVGDGYHFALSSSLNPKLQNDVPTESRMSMPPQADKCSVWTLAILMLSSRHPRQRELALHWLEYVNAVGGTMSQQSLELTKLFLSLARGSVEGISVDQ